MGSVDRVQSTLIPSNNVLLKLTIPKRTGRKRKMGSNEPFTDAPELEATEPTRRNAKDLFRSLSDNPSKYTIEPVGRVERTHVFQGLFITYILIHQVHANFIIGMPGFVYSTTTSSFANRFKYQIILYDYKSRRKKPTPRISAIVFQGCAQALIPRLEVSRTRQKTSLTSAPGRKRTKPHHFQRHLLIDVATRPPGHTHSLFAEESPTVYAEGQSAIKLP